MPYTKKTKMYYPKKGSAEAYAWAEKMQKARAKKKPLTKSQKRHKNK